MWVPKQSQRAYTELKGGNSRGNFFLSTLQCVIHLFTILSLRKLMEIRTALDEILPLLLSGLTALEKYSGKPLVSTTLVPGPFLPWGARCGGCPAHPTSGHSCSWCCLRLTLALAFRLFWPLLWLHLMASFSLSWPILSSTCRRKETHTDKRPCSPIIFFHFFLSRLSWLLERPSFITGSPTIKAQILSLLLGY